MHKLMRYVIDEFDGVLLDDYGWEPFQLKVLKQDLDRYIESDTEVSREYDRIAFQEEKVDFLQATLKSITARQWDIKNAIEWRKFVNGI